MRHIDLFSGIGGFALAVDEVFGKSEHIFCEIDPYCQALLKKRFKGSVIYDDIRTLSRERLTADTNGNGQPRGSEKIHTAETEQQTLGHAEECCAVDILTGGFPCQPFSQAGKRKGTDDNRYLWPEMLRVIKEVKPTWVIGENVAGILSMVQYESEVRVESETDLFGNRADTHKKRGRGIVYGIIRELEQIGYSVQTLVIPAVAVNAPHRRDRVWFVAHANIGGLEGTKESGRNGINAVGSDSNAPDTSSERLEGHTELRQEREISELKSNSDWSKNWLEVATELCRVDDGLPAELDGLKLSKSRHRVERLKSLGNAIVPQVAMEIMRGIKKVSA